MAEVLDYIIIGSGFGGSVSAMRLSEKGYSVLVIEKGKHYRNEDFPKTNWNFKKYFWAPLFGWHGFQKITFFKNTMILSGVGVGGGSLGYANTHMFPPDEFFGNPAWSHLCPDKSGWKKTLIPFYEKARRMLGTTRNKAFYRADEVLREVAGEMNRSSTFNGVDIGVYFGDCDKETDPYFNGLGPMRKGCTECAGCMVGCRHNAKNTLDKNYLYFAQKSGAQVIAETKAEKIVFHEGIYSVHTRSGTSSFSTKKNIFRSRGLVIAGGVLGTMDLLLKQKYKYKTLPHLSKKLGENLRTNSEMLCGVTAASEKLNQGVSISSVFNPDDSTHIEIVKYPDDSNSMKAFAMIATGPGNLLVRPLKLLGNIFLHPVRFAKHIFGKNWATRSVIFLVMQSLDSSMKMVYKKFPFFRISIQNKKENRVPSYIDIGQKTMFRYAKKVDGIPQNATTEILFNMSSTAHIIGGCPMGKNADEGMINEKFEAFNYPGMYILDGSVIPCNLGVNPSLTITALSEYAMSLVPEKKGNTIISLEEQMRRVKH
ncbi:MAG: GMC family oxidoreductase [Bacteroidetes bacterium]|nr:GMC family oxidoreductase [Bacteroidota bacterium]